MCCGRLPNPISIVKKIVLILALLSSKVELCVECEAALLKQILIRVVVVFCQPATDWSHVCLCHARIAQFDGTWETTIDIAFGDAILYLIVVLRGG